MYFKSFQQIRRQTRLILAFTEMISQHNTSYIQSSDLNDLCYTLPHIAVLRRHCSYSFIILFHISRIQYITKKSRIYKLVVVALSLYSPLDQRIFTSKIFQICWRFSSSFDYVLHKYRIICHLKKVLQQGRNQSWQLYIFELTLNIDKLDKTPNRIHIYCLFLLFYVVDNLFNIGNKNYF